MSTMTVRYLDGDRFAIGVRDHTITVDQPLADGGEDTAPTPTELLVASLASCVAFQARRYLARHQLPTTDLTVTADYNLEPHPARVTDIRIDIQLPDAVPAQWLDALLAVTRHCAVHNTLADAPTVTVTLAGAPAPAASRSAQPMSGHTYRPVITGTGFAAALDAACWLASHETARPEGNHSMSYGKTVTLDAPFTQTVTRVRDAHAEQGFGVLTEIDVTATMHAKLGKDLEDYLILGACNPPLAYQALGVDRSLGLLLPCNIVVRAAEDGTIVEILDPQIMVTLTDRPELKPVADQAARRLAAVLAALVP